MSDRDAAKNLLMKVQASDHSPPKTFNSLLDEFQSIQRRHVEKNVYRAHLQRNSDRRIGVAYSHV